MTSVFWAKGLGGHAIGVMGHLPFIHTADRAQPPLRRNAAEVHVRLRNGAVLPIFAVHLSPHCTLDRETTRRRGPLPAGHDGGTARRR